MQQNPGVIFQPTTLAVLQTEIGWSISWNIRILQDQIINFQCTRSTKKKAEEELAKQIVQTIYLKIPELQEKTLKEKKKIG